MATIYKLEEVDYHTYLLFTISKSSSAIKTRGRIRLLMTISLFLFAFIAYGNNSKGQMIYFIFLGFLTFFFMPFYTRWSYRKTYLKHVRKYYKDRMSEPTTLLLNDRSFSISDSQGDSLVGYSELDEVNELEAYCFLKVKSGQSIIIPISKIENGTKILEQLKNISQVNSITWNDERNWIWK